MCPEEGKLQAYLDGELNIRELPAIKVHLAFCPGCRRRLLILKENSRFAAVHLTPYLLSLERKNTGFAWVSLAARLNGGPKRMGGNAGDNYTGQTGGKDISGSNETQRKNIWRVVHKMGKYRKWAVAAGLVLALSVAMSFSSVRSFAGELLTVFRVEQVQAVTINPQDVAQLQKALGNGNGRVDVNNLGRFEVTGKQQMKQDVTPAAARQVAGFSVKLPAAPAGYGQPRLNVQTGSTVKLTLDTERANSLLKSLGSNQLLPASLNGRTFSLRMPAGVMALYPSVNGQGKSLVVAQSRSPELTVPSGTDVEAVRRALLAIPALPENLRQQLAAVSDWQHTLLVPVPQGNTQQVQVNGVRGIFIQPAAANNGPGNKEMNASALIWQHSGMVYMIMGPQLNQQEALALAAQMK